jgi:hypothetical protein
MVVFRPIEDWMLIAYFSVLRHEIPIVYFGMNVPKELGCACCFDFFPGMIYEN